MGFPSATLRPRDSFDENLLVRPPIELGHKTQRVACDTERGSPCPGLSDCSEASKPRHLPDAVSSAETSPITLTVDKPYPWKTQVSLTTKLAMQQSAIAMALATR